MAVKHQVLDILRSSEDFVSGELLANKISVTRAAVWKAIEALRSEGFVIEAISNKGYKLIIENEFNKSSIMKGLNEGIDVEFFDTIDSTNTYAKSLLVEDCAKFHKHVVVASSQTKGRGRLGRTFYSPSLKGIYLSLIYCKKNITDPAFITATSSLAVSRAIKEVYGLDVQIKWINDIYKDGLKVGGILTEGVINFETGSIDGVVIGIGINIASDSIPEDLQHKATGLLTDSKSYKRSELCSSIINKVYNILESEEDIKTLASEYRNKSNLIGKTVLVTPVIDQKEGSYECKVLDISDDFKLVVETSSREIKELYSGEVSLHYNKN